MANYSPIRLYEDGLRQMQLDRFKVFEAQDLEEGDFDITFEIEGKKLHAHKFILTTASETMKAMISDRWSKKDEAVKLESYSYDHFYRLLSFLYSGECHLNPENVFPMVDVAEFYGVALLKDLCDGFISVKNFHCNVQNVEEMVEFAQKYDLSRMSLAVNSFIRHNFNAIINDQKFMETKEPFIRYLSTLCTTGDADFHAAVFNWAEQKAIRKKPSDDDGTFNLYEATKAEFPTPLPRFEKMSLDFLMDTIVEKGFALTPIEFKDLFKHQTMIYGEKGAFKQLFYLARKQALQKQKTSSSGDDFDISASIKNDLARITEKFAFHLLDERFLMNAVVTHGIITEEQAKHVYDTQVIITNNGKSILGVFKDEIGLRQTYDEKETSFCVTRISTTKIRFPETRFTIPTTPCALAKMKGVEWYLCLEHDGVLTFKKYAEVGLNDYLLAEMKNITHFELTRGKETVLSAEYNNPHPVP